MPSTGRMITMSESTTSRATCTVVCDDCGRMYDSRIEWLEDDPCPGQPDERDERSY